MHLHAKINGSIFKAVLTQLAMLYLNTISKYKVIIQTILYSDSFGQNKSFKIN